MNTSVKGSLICLNPSLALLDVAVHTWGKGEQEEARLLQHIVPLTE